MNNYDLLYPNLPNEKPNMKRGENFRLSKSCNVLARLENEEKHYEGMRKKYGRARNVFQNICVGSGSLSIILSMSGLGTSLSGFGIVVGVPLGVVGGFCGLISVLSGTYSKRLGKNISKHEQTVAVARSKINTIKDLISKALKDEKISDEEFSLILKEVNKFEDLKLGIRRRYRLEEKRQSRNEIEKKRGKYGIAAKRNSRGSDQKIDTNRSTRRLRLRLGCIYDLKFYF